MVKWDNVTAVMTEQDVTKQKVLEALKITTPCMNLDPKHTGLVFTSFFVVMRSTVDYYCKWVTLCISAIESLQIDNILL